MIMATRLLLRQSKKRKKKKKKRLRRRKLLRPLAKRRLQLMMKMPLRMLSRMLRLVQLRKLAMLKEKKK